MPEHKPIAGVDHRCGRLEGAESVHKVDELAYVGVSANDLDVWSKYAQEVLGHEVTADSDSSNLYLRMDERHHRLIVHPAGNEPEDVSYVGWQVRNADVMDAIAATLDAAGVTVTEGKPEEAATRRVLGLVHFTYCNPRHHSLAFFGNPQPRRRTYHVMLEHTSIDEWARHSTSASSREM